MNYIFQALPINPGLCLVFNADSVFPSPQEDACLGIWFPFATLSLLRSIPGLGFMSSTICLLPDLSLHSLSEDKDVKRIESEYW